MTHSSVHVTNVLSGIWKTRLPITKTRYRSAVHLSNWTPAHASVQATQRSALGSGKTRLLTTKTRYRSAVHMSKHMPPFRELVAASALRALRAPPNRVRRFAVRHGARCSTNHSDAGKPAACSAVYSPTRRRLAVWATAESCSS
jgi:hypothetical protein